MISTRIGLALLSLLLSYPCLLNATTTQLVANGNFSEGSSSWTVSGDFHAGTQFNNYNSAPGYAYLSLADGSPGNALDGEIYQQISIPSNASPGMVFTFWYQVSTEENSASDVMRVTVRDTHGSHLKTLAIVDSQDVWPFYVVATADLDSYIGQTVQIHFEATTNGTAPSVFRIDDVSLLADVEECSSLPDSDTNPATEITASGATLNGDVNPNGCHTQGWHMLGLAPDSLTTEVGRQSVGGGTREIAMQAYLSGLPCGTTYYYGTFSSNQAGTDYDNDHESFTTLPCSNPPIAEALPPVNVTQTSATLKGNIDPSGLLTLFYFGYRELGSSASYFYVPSPSGNAGSGSDVTTVSADITGLSCDTAYEFYLLAVSDGGHSISSSKDFFAAPCSGEPGVFTISAGDPFCDRYTPQGPAVRVSWSASPGADYYRLIRNDVPYPNGLQILGTTFLNNANLIEGNSYGYSVEAINGAGSLYSSNAVTIDIPYDVCGEPGIPPLPSVVDLESPDGSTGGQPTCGNSILESGETCDNGSENGSCPSQCGHSCTLNVCSPSALRAEVDAPNTFGEQTAELRGRAFSPGSEAQLWFTWGDNLSLVNSTPRTTTDPSSDWSYTNTEVGPIYCGLAYYFQLHAENSSGAVESSEILSFTKPGCQPSPADSRFLLWSQEQTCNGKEPAVLLRWQPIPNSGNVYIVSRTDGGYSEVVHTGRSGTIHLVDRGMSYNQLYEFQVTANTMDGLIATSVEPVYVVNHSCLAAGQEGAPPGPTTIWHENARCVNGEAAVPLRWSESAGADSYSLRRITPYPGMSTTINNIFTTEVVDSENLYPRVQNIYLLDAINEAGTYRTPSRFKTDVFLSSDICEHPNDLPGAFTMVADEPLCINGVPAVPLVWTEPSNAASSYKVKLVGPFGATASIGVTGNSSFIENIFPGYTYKIWVVAESIINEDVVRSSNSVLVRIPNDICAAQNAPPSTEAREPLMVKANTAVLDSAVNPNGSSTAVYFEWGESAAYGSSTTSVDIGEGMLYLHPGQVVDGLTCETEYHSRVVATNPYGTSYGNDVVFTTGDCPVVINTPPTLTLIEPDGTDDLADEVFNISWSDADPDDNAAITLAYSLDSDCSVSTIVVSGLWEDDAVDQYTWDTSLVAEGMYYIETTINDGVNPVVVGCSSHPITVARLSPFLFADSFESGDTSAWTNMPVEPTAVTILEDNFDDGQIDPAKWARADGSSVVEHNGYVELTADVTDQFGVMETAWLEIDPIKKLTISRRALQEYGNQKYIGQLLLESGNRSAPVLLMRYGHMDLVNGTYCAVWDFFATRHGADPHNCSDMESPDVSAPVAPVWGMWYEERIVYDPVTGAFQYFIDSQLKLDWNLGPLPLSGSANELIRLHFAPRGWKTGHRLLMDDLVVTQE